MEALNMVVLGLGGFIASLYASMVGGMAFITFTLLILFGLPVPVAVGTQRLVGFAMELTAAVKFHLAKQLNWKVAIAVGVFVSAGSYIGANLLKIFPEDYLNYFTVGVLMFALFLVLFSKDIEREITNFKRKNFFIAIPALFLLGIYGGLIGVASGTLLVFAPFFMGFNLIKSAAIARVAGVMMSISALYVFISSNMIRYDYAAPLIIGVVIGSWIGVSMNLKARNIKLMKWLIAFVLSVSIIHLIFFR